MELVDVHCHLESEEFAGRLDSVLDEARRAGVVRFITASIRPPQWEVSQALASRYPDVECALGVHPWYAMPEDIEGVQGLYAAVEKGAAAIGEIGLDRKVDSPPWALQAAVCGAQLRIAKDVDLPVILHCRGAFNELIEMLKHAGAPARGGILHNFTGSVEIAEDLMRLGMAFSLGGILTYRNSAKRNKMLRRIYPDHFLLETDSPDIPPIEARGRPNVPANILYNLRAAAEILEESEETVAAATTRNAGRIFGFASS